MNNTSSFRRIAASLRTALVLITFTALAAVGLAASKSIRPSAAPAAAAAHTAPTSSRETRGLPVHTAPAGCPMPAGAFRTH